MSEHRNRRVRVTSRELNLRGVALVTTGLCEEARLRGGGGPLAAAALGRALNAALLASTMVKGNHRIGLQFKVAGPLKEVYADADGEGNVRGYVLAPDAEAPPRPDGQPDVNRGLGAGVLSVTSDLGLRERYQGIVPLLHGDIAGDLAHYFSVSAQIPSHVDLGFWLGDDGSVAAAGGLLLQNLPGAGEDAFARLEGNLLGLPPLQTVLRREDAPEYMLERVFHGFQYEVNATEPVSFRCPCSRSRVERTLIALGEDELQDMIEKEAGAEVRCEFCNEFYRFDRTELESLLDRSRQA